MKNFDFFPKNFFPLHEFHNCLNKKKYKYEKLLNDIALEGIKLFFYSLFKSLKLLQFYRKNALDIKTRNETILLSIIRNFKMFQKKNFLRPEYSK